MSRRTTLALMLAAALLSGGCGTLENVNRPCFPPPDAPTRQVCRAYGGVRTDWDVMTQYQWDRTESFLDYVTIPPLAAMHLLFTCVGDTITLPYTTVEEARRAYYGPSGPPNSSSNFVPVVATDPAPQVQPAVPQAVSKPLAAPRPNLSHFTTLN